MVVSGEVDQLITDWSKDGNMSPALADVVHNTIVSNCLPTALLVTAGHQTAPAVPVAPGRRGAQSASTATAWKWPDRPFFSTTVGISLAGLPFGHHLGSKNNGHPFGRSPDVVQCERADVEAVLGERISDI